MGGLKLLSGSRLNLKQLLCGNDYLMESNEETTTLCRGGGGGNNNSNDGLNKAINDAVGQLASGGGENNNNNNNNGFRQEFLDNALVVSQFNGGRRELQNDIQRKYQVGIGNGDVVRDWPKITEANYGAVNGVLHIVDHVILPTI